MWNKKGGFMLVETMSPKEMMDELHKDYDFLYNNNIRFMENGGIKRLKKQYAKFPAYIMRDVKTTRGNRYLCNILFRKRGDVFKMKAIECRDAILQTKEGIATVAIVYSGKYRKEVLHIYRPHVFKRYKERMGLDMDGIELVKHFCLHNSDTIVHDDYKHKEGDMEHDFMLTIYDGALFGTEKEVDGCVCYTVNTFIANETMQDGYKSRFNKRHNEAIDDIEFFGLDNTFDTDFKKRK